MSGSVRNFFQETDIKKTNRLGLAVKIIFWNINSCRSAEQIPDYVNQEFALQVFFQAYENVNVKKETNNYPYLFDGYIFSALFHGASRRKASA